VIRVNINIDEVIKPIVEKLTEIERGEFGNNLLREVAVTQLAEMKVRIFEEGKDERNGVIGSYSTKPIYVNPNNSPKKFTTVGKTGKSKFSDGTPHKTRFFAQGYNGFKSEIGRNKIGTVNLSLSRDFQNKMTIIGTSNGWGIGWLEDEKYKRALHFQQKYRKQIFSQTKEEKEITQNVINNYLKENI
jgi:hypothetical protein